MIEIQHISKKYGRHRILNDISFTISPGECIGIVGANGSGKTTLLSIISGMNKADKGNILADGKIISNSSKLLSKYISYVPQENPLISELTAMDNLRLWYSGTKKELEEELQNGILKLLGIDTFIHKTVSKMSGGMKKRLSIGIALLEKPALLIMDEPSAALDLSGKYNIKEYMKHYTTKMNGSILVVSHDQNELSICNKLFLLKDGNLTQIPTNMTDDALVKLL
ncbi:MAG: ABC transporter ATP-binding protein [Lachnospiraceae bacterium]|nr:ABC transporter ATP-binding protein [Lachnospiraceae bacterium]